MTDYQRRRLMSNRKDYTSRRRLYPNYMGEDMNEMRKSRTANGQYRRRKDYYDNETEYRKPNDYEHDYEYEEEYEGNHPFVIEGEMGFDYAEMSKLSKRDIMEWKHNLVNADGSRGEHFKFDYIMKAAKDMGIRFHEYDEKELCLTVNMLYSDYCEVLKPFISPDKELYVYVALGKAFLEDEDAPEGSEKLALYYHCVVNAE